MKKTIVSLSFTFLFAMAMCIIVGLGGFNFDTRKKLDEAKANTVEDTDFSEKVSNGAFPGGIAGWGYENGNNGWFTGDSSYGYDAVSASADGTGSFRMGAADGKVTGYSKTDVTLQAGVTYLFKVKIKTSQIAVTGGFECYARVTDSDSSENVNYAKAVYDPAIYGESMEWKSYEYRFTADYTGVYKVHLKAWAIIGGSVWFDDVSVCAIDFSERISNGKFGDFEGWGYENGNNGWFTGTSYYGIDSCSASSDGTGSLKLGGVNGVTGYTMTDVQLQEGVEYILSLSFKSEELSLAGGFECFARVEGTGAAENSEYAKFSYNPSQDGQPLDWINYSQSFTADYTGVYKVHIKVWAVTGGAVWFDDLSLTAKGSADYAEMVDNGSFNGNIEGWGTEGVPYGWFTSQSDFGYDSSVSRTADGTGSFRFGSAGGVVTGFSRQRFKLYKGTVYRLSGSIKADSVTNIGGYEGHIKIVGENGSSIGEYAAITYNPGRDGATMDWRDGAVCFAADYTGYYYLELKVWAVTGGSVWFDEISLRAQEQADAAEKLENGDFDGGFSGWGHLNGNNGWFTENSVYGYDSSVSFEQDGTGSFKFGEIDGVVTGYSLTDAELTGGIQYTLGAAIKAESVAVIGGFECFVRVLNPQGGEICRVSYNPSEHGATSDWLYSEASFTASESGRFKVEIRVWAVVGGCIWIDGVTLAASEIQNAWTPEMQAFIDGQSAKTLFNGENQSFQITPPWGGRVLYFYGGNWTEKPFGATQAGVYPVAVKVKAPMYGEYEKQFDFEIEPLTSSDFTAEFTGGAEYAHVGEKLYLPDFRVYDSATGEEFYGASLTASMGEYVLENINSDTEYFIPEVMGTLTLKVKYGGLTLGEHEIFVGADGNLLDSGDWSDNGRIYSYLNYNAKINMTMRLNSGGSGFYFIPFRGTNTANGVDGGWYNSFSLRFSSAFEQNGMLRGNGDLGEMYTPFFMYGGAQYQYGSSFVFSYKPVDVYGADGEFKEVRVYTWINGISAAPYYSQSAMVGQDESGLWYIKVGVNDVQWYSARTDNIVNYLSPAYVFANITSTNGTNTFEVTSITVGEKNTFSGIAFESKEKVKDGTALTSCVEGTLPAGAAVIYRDGAGNVVSESDVSLTQPGEKTFTAEISADGYYTRRLYCTLKVYDTSLVAGGLQKGANGAMTYNGAAINYFGVNYYDLLIGVFDYNSDSIDEFKLNRALSALDTLAGYNVKAIRFSTGFFYPGEWSVYENNNAAYLYALDKIMNKAASVNIGLIPSFFWTDSICQKFNEHYATAYSNPATNNSASMNFLWQYTQLLVTRYASHPAVFMWEYGNEWNLGCDLPNWFDIHPDTVTADKITSQVHSALTDYWASLVKSLDPYDRVIGTGDAELRPAQYNIYKNNSWAVDSLSEHRQALARLTPANVGAISTHIYGKPTGSELPDLLGTSDWNSRLALLMQNAAALNKTCYVGEAGFSYPDVREITMTQLQNHYASIINAAKANTVPLVLFWNYDPAAERVEGMYNDRGSGIEYSWHENWDKGSVILNLIKNA